MKSYPSVEDLLWPSDRWIYFGLKCVRYLSPLPRRPIPKSARLPCDLVAFRIRCRDHPKAQKTSGFCDHLIFGLKLARGEQSFNYL